MEGEVDFDALSHTAVSLECSKHHNQSQCPSQDGGFVFLLL